MTLYVLGSLSEISRDATKPRTMIAEEEIIFFLKDCEKRYSSKNSLKDHLSVHILF